MEIVENLYNLKLYGLRNLIIFPLNSHEEQKRLPP